MSSVAQSCYLQRGSLPGFRAVDLFNGLADVYEKAPEHLPGGAMVDVGLV